MTPSLPPWVQALLVAVPTSILSCLGMALMLRPEPSPVSAAQSDPGEVIRRLDELQRPLDVQSAEAAHATSPVAKSARQPVTGQRPDIESLVSRLTAMLSRIQPAAGGQPIPRNLPVNHMRLSDLHNLEKRDAEAAKRSVLLLTATEIAEGFGFPDRVSNGGGGIMFWNYYHFDSNGQRNGNTVFSLMDGRVLNHHIRIENR